MGTKTEIEWTDATWWPMKETKQLLQPLSWRKPKRIFVNSMSDLFHENVTDEMRDKIFAVMGLAWQHSFQILTKRPQRMLSYMQGLAAGDPAERLENAAYELETDEECGCHLANWINGWSRWCEAPDDGNPLNGTKPRWPLPNVWLGVSVENQATADERIPMLLQTPAAVRFISAEPLLGPVGLKGWLIDEVYKRAFGIGKLHWVICGGESGPGARPMHPDWARSLRDQCKAAGVPFFFKQWGEWLPAGQARETLLTTAKRDQSLNWPMYRVGKKLAGSLLDGVEHKEFPTQEYKESE